MPIAAAAVAAIISFSRVLVPVATCLFVSILPQAASASKPPPFAIEPALVSASSSVPV